MSGSGLARSMTRVRSLLFRPRWVFLASYRDADLWDASRKSEDSPRGDAEIPMPYYGNFREIGAHTHREQVLALFDSPALYSLKEILDPTTPVRPGGSRGRRANGYPPLLHYAVSVLSRIYGSQHHALRELRSPGLWAEVSDLYARKVKQPVRIPDHPPSDDDQDRFVGWLVSTPGLMARLSDTFTRAAVKQAIRLGNFTDGGWPDYTQVDPCHTVVGDGTYIKPYSDALKDKSGVPVGSRAKDPRRARIQAAVTDPKPDQKTARGINHVTVSTWTRAGWVVLANRQAFHAEVHQAREMIEVLHDILDDKLHTVVWDRALKGLDLAIPMADRRLHILTKPVARREDIRRTDGFTAPILSTHQARKMYEESKPLPLGTCVYARSEPHAPDVTHSQYYWFKTLRDADCRHDLWVDDGALYSVEENSHGWKVKTSYVRTIRATPVPGRNGATEFVLHLPCSRAPRGFHEFSETYTHVRAAPSSGPRRALYHLRPLPRADEAFAEAHGLRNLTESYNSWLKNRLGKHRRAMRLSTQAQFLDQIAAGTLANALTWHRHLIQQSHGVTAAS